MDLTLTRDSLLQFFEIQQQCLKITVIRLTNKPTFVNLHVVKNSIGFLVNSKLEETIFFVVINFKSI